jgi:hypothetical protein
MAENGVFDSKKSQIMQKYDHSIVFRKTPFCFARDCHKSQKIVIKKSTREKKLKLKIHS